MKLLLSFLVAIASCLPVAAHASSCDETPALSVVEAARRATVTIRVPGSDGADEAVGAGFVHRQTGKIVTNVHVVGDRDMIRIGFADGRIVTGQVSGRDNVADIAVIDADLDGIVGIDFSDKPGRVGETVFAVGTPFGLGHSVTRGIVSALDRPIDAITPFGMIQHDAPLNPGSSGGPVIDTTGKVIGVNVAMPDGFRRDVGIAYAIPAAVAKPVAISLAAGIPVIERRLGVTVRALTPRLAEAIGVAAEVGALVEAVAPRSPAETAGIVASDIIIALGTHEVRELRDLAIGVSKADPAASLPVRILRGQEIVMVELPPVPVSAAAAPVSAPPWRAERKPVPASELGFSFAANGSATIHSVDRGTAAAAAGIAAGDVILAVGRTKISSAGEAKGLIGEYVVKDFALLLADTRGSTRYVVIDPWAKGLDGDALGGNMRDPRSASY